MKNFALFASGNPMHFFLVCTKMARKTPLFVHFQSYFAKHSDWNDSHFFMYIITKK